MPTIRRALARKPCVTGSSAVVAGNEFGKPNEGIMRA
jgi:hypothetical protein